MAANYFKEEQVSVKKEPNKFKREVVAYDDVPDFWGLFIDDVAFQLFVYIKSHLNLFFMSMPSYEVDCSRKQITKNFFLLVWQSVSSDWKHLL